MQRPFSVIRRRPNLLDVVIPVQDGVDGYRLDVATNFDAVYAPLITATRMGHIDPSLRNRGHVPVNGRMVRILFDPDNYAPPLDDTKPFWMRFTPITGGVPGTPSAGSLVLPDGDRYRAIIIAGDAPAGADVSASLKIDFPYMVEGLHIRNTDPGNSLYVATEIGGAEFEVPFGTAQTLDIRAATPFILVRGGGGDVPFSASCTTAFPR
jgi:hypothetical protein